MDESRKDCFLASLDRCSANRNFILVFYERFLSRDEAIRDKFKHTDFEKQYQMLLRSLRLAAGATSGDPKSLREIRERAETHDRHHLDIKPAMYGVWLKTVIEVASEYDEEWNDEVEDAWNTILGHVIKHMAKHY
jgi:hypothetical protein